MEIINDRMMERWKKGKETASKRVEKMMVIYPFTSKKKRRRTAAAFPLISHRHKKFRSCVPSPFSSSSFSRLG